MSGNTITDVSYLFGKDLRGYEFITAAEKSKGSELAPGSAMYQIVTQGTPNVAHEDFMMFLMNTALFHGSLTGDLTGNPTFRQKKTGATLSLDQVLIDKIYKRWHSLSDETQRIYKEYTTLFGFNESKEIVNIEPEDYIKNPMDNVSVTIKDSFVDLVPEYFQNARDRTTQIKVINDGDRPQTLDINGSPNITVVVNKKTSDTTGVTYIRAEKDDYESDEERLDDEERAMDPPTGKGGASGGYQYGRGYATLFKQIYKQLKDAGNYNKHTIVIQDNGKDINEFTITGDLNQIYQSSKKDTFGLTDDLVRQHLFQFKASTFAKAEDAYKDGDFTDFIYSGVWTLEDGVFKKKVDGKWVEYGQLDETTRCLLNEKKDCYSTQISQGLCKEYIYKCLIKGDKKHLNHCIDTIKMSDLRKKASDEINNMHPVVALRTLQQFGFRRHKVLDSESGMMLKKIEDVSHWLEHYARKNYEESIFQKLVYNNGDVLYYLDLLAQFVNANPGILNPDYDGPTDESCGKWKQTQWGEKLLKVRECTEDEGSQLFFDAAMMNAYTKLRRHGYFTRYSPFNLGRQGYLVTPFGSSITPSLNPVYRGQHGGANGQSFLKDFVQNKRAAGGHFLKEIFEGLLHELELRHKNLDKAQVEQIRQKIKDLIRIQERLFKTLYYIEEYNHLMDAQQNYSRKTLTIDQMRRLVERHSRLRTDYMSHEEYLGKIIEGLEKLAFGENGDYKKLNIDKLLQGQQSMKPAVRGDKC